MLKSIQQALNPGVRLREVFGWAMYDFANSGYTLVVITAIYSQYFTDVVVGANRPWGPTAWSWALAFSYLIVMLTAPLLGQWADQHGSKRRLLMYTTFGCVISTAALAITGEGSVIAALLLIVLSNTCYSWGEGFIAAFLPELAKREKMGLISGLGWGIGYLGGMLTLGICLIYIQWVAQVDGATEQVSTIMMWNAVPVTMWIVATTYGLCACATFVFLKERAQPSGNSNQKNRNWFEQLRMTLAALKSFPDLRQVLLSTVFYQGGVAVVIALAAIYAKMVIGMELQETIMMMFVLNIAAVVGAFLLGHVQDSFGHKATLIGVLCAWAVTCLGVALCTTKWQFWIAATCAGLCMGSSQSIGRAMVGLFAPQERLAEFFGLWSLATRFASIMGLVLVGALNYLLGLSWSVAIISLFFIVGMLMLKPLDVKRGIDLAMHGESKD